MTWKNTKINRSYTIQVGLLQARKILWEGVIATAAALSSNAFDLQKH